MSLHTMFFIDFLNMTMCIFMVMIVMMLVRVVFMHMMFTVFHRVDDRTGRHKEKCLKEGMCNQMEECRRKRTHTERGDHKAKL